MARKAEWALPFTESLGDPDSRTGTPTAGQRLLRDLIAFLCFEGIFFYTGFAQVLAQQDGRSEHQLASSGLVTPRPPRLSTCV